MRHLNIPHLTEEEFWKKWKIQNEFSLSGSGQLLPGDEALVEGEVPTGPDLVSGGVLHFQPQLDGDDQHLEDFGCSGAHTCSDLGRGTTPDPGVSAGLQERKFIEW